MHWSVSRAWNPKISRSPRDATTTSLNVRPSGISSGGSRQVTGRLEPAISGTLLGLGLLDHLARFGPAVREVLVDEDRAPAGPRPGTPPAPRERTCRADRASGACRCRDSRRARRSSRTASTASLPVPKVSASAIVGLRRIPCRRALARPRSVAGRRLLDEQAGDLERRLVQPIAVVNDESVDESSDDVVGVRQVVIDGRESPRSWAARSSLAPWLRRFVRSRTGRGRISQPGHAGRRTGHFEKLAARRTWGHPGCSPMQSNHCFHDPVSSSIISG